MLRLDRWAEAVVRRRVVYPAIYAAADEKRLVKTEPGAIERLVSEKRMQPVGLAQVEAAKADGRWDQAYDGQKDMAVPEDFLAAVSKNKKALAFYESLNKANKYAIAWRLQTARKPETREKRLKTFVQMMRDGKKIHP
ncbi:MAG: YdeI/OmpD-associated family protein [Fimbriimonadales bacterium]